MIIVYYLYHTQSNNMLYSSGNIAYKGLEIPLGLHSPFFFSIS